MYNIFIKPCFYFYYSLAYIFSIFNSLCESEIRRDGIIDMEFIAVLQKDSKSREMTNSKATRKR